MEACWRQLPIRISFAGRCASRHAPAWGLQIGNTRADSPEGHTHEQGGKVCAKSWAPKIAPEDASWRDMGFAGRTWDRGTMGSYKGGRRDQRCTGKARGVRRVAVMLCLRCVSHCRASIMRRPCSRAGDSKSSIKTKSKFRRHSHAPQSRLLQSSTARVREVAKKRLGDAGSPCPCCCCAQVESPRLTMSASALTEAGSAQLGRADMCCVS